MRPDYYFEFEDLLRYPSVVASDRDIIEADELITSSLILI
jgi:hypothetical protein